MSRIKGQALDDLYFKSRAATASLPFTQEPVIKPAAIPDPVTLHSEGKTRYNRTIDITTYEGDYDSVIVEGVLNDERLVETYRPTGDTPPPGTVHHMIIRMEIKGPKLLIEEIEVEMPTIPYDACLETQGCLDQLKGIPIVAGFTNKVKKMVGGRKGCCHLVSLLTAMAPAAVSQITD